MGPERLIAKAGARALTLALVVSPAACRHSQATPAIGVEAKARVRHVQIFHAMTTPKRRELATRLRARDPSPASGEWNINEEALVSSLTVVDPFAGFLRRARRNVPPRRPREGGPVSEVVAARAARGFVGANSDLLGLPRRVVLALSERTREIAASDHASPYAAYVVRFEAPFASKGYEAFRELDNLADIEVVVDDDGQVSSFINLSRVHPHLTIDTRPELGRDDPRVVAKLIGRKLFAVADETDAGGHRDVRELERIPLGEVRADDVEHVRLVVHASPGPQLAWFTFRLCYLVEVAKQAPSPPSDIGPVTASPEFFFFRYVVDADTGDVIEDARAPFSGPVWAAP